MPVRFFSEQTKFHLPSPRKTSTWVKQSIKSEGGQFAELNFIFCSDDYLREINIQYLNHNTFTDIVTFDTSDDANALSGDIFISIDRVRENALKLGLTFDNELHRVIIHGVLHLLGYSDKKPTQKLQMRKKEDAYLSLR